MSQTSRNFSQFQRSQHRVTKIDHIEDDDVSEVPTNMNLTPGPSHQRFVSLDPKAMRNNRSHNTTTVVKKNRINKA